jgi:HSP20 family protein
MTGLRERDGFRNIFSQMEDMMENLQNNTTLESLGTNLPVDMTREEDTIKVTADIPGVTKDDIDLRATENHLEISATTEQEIKEENEKYVRRERSSRSFHRRLEFPQPIDTETLSAQYSSGVLTVEADTQEDDSIDIDIE